MKTNPLPVKTGNTTRKAGESEGISISPIYKEVCRVDDDHYRLVLRTDDYSKRMSKFLILMGIAKHDFPDLEDSDFEIVVYGGDRRKRIPGLEFSLPEGSVIPADYENIGTLEPTI